MLNLDIKLPPQDERTRKACVDPFTICRWPEFILFAERLGIDLSKPYERIVVDLNFAIDSTGPDRAGIYLKQRGSDAGQAADVPLETTSNLNEQFRTFQPRSE